MAATVGCFALGGAIYGPFLALSMTLMQQRAPRHELAPLLAARSAALLTAAPVGTALGGPLVAAFGPRQTLAGSGLATVGLGVVAAACSPSGGDRGTEAVPGGARSSGKQLAPRPGDAVPSCAGEISGRAGIPARSHASYLTTIALERRQRHTLWYSPVRLRHSAVVVGGEARRRALRRARSARRARSRAPAWPPTTTAPPQDPRPTHDPALDTEKEVARDDVPLPNPARAGLAGLPGAHPGRPTLVLEPGRHRRQRATAYQLLDLREQLQTVAPQELLTADGVTVRVTAFARWAIGDPVAFTEKVTDPAGSVYAAVQLALRDALAARDAEALVRAPRATLAAEVVEQLRAAAAEVGVRLAEVVVKDVVLPHDLRAAYAELVVGRQRAQAQLEAARAETAALRSMANAAKLLDDHPALARLRLVQALPVGARVELVHDPGTPAG
ncbi:MAG: SPFH domain-containing protein [Nocardioides sp.]